MEKEQDIFSQTVNLCSQKLKVLSGLLMGLNPIAVELNWEEVQALGFLLNDISDELIDWNTGKDNG